VEFQKVVDYLMAVEILMALVNQNPLVDYHLVAVNLNLVVLVMVVDYH
jgi:hypothetical protein